MVAMLSVKWALGLNHDSGCSTPSPRHVPFFLRSARDRYRPVEAAFYATMFVQHGPFRAWGAGVHCPHDFDLMSANIVVPVCL